MSASGTPYSCLEVERTRAPGELDDVGRVLDRHEAAAPVLPLDEPRDAPVEHPGPEALGNEVDELLAAENPFRVGRIHDRLLGAGEAQSGPGDHDGAGRHLVAVVRA